jgi:Protein of unknown function (DUF1566)
MTLKRASMSALVVATLCVAATSAEAQGPYYAVPSWDQTLPASTRFIVLSNMSSAAVLDRETGLVWERVPGSGTFPWLDAQASCNVKSVGNRKGWRLPTVQELASLVDPSIPFPGPTLPPGNPFQNWQSNVYWSSTTLASDSSQAWFVLFSNGVVYHDFKDILRLVWCVRGGQGVDPQ